MERRSPWAGLRWGPVIVLWSVVLAGGCVIPSAHTASRNYALRPDVLVDPPPAGPPAHCDDCVVGGRLFKLYCGSCHNARPLGERPFNNYEVAVSHMRDQAYLTGKEYRQIIHFLRRWHDIGPPTPSTTPSPKRFLFSQPIPELREEPAPTAEPVPPPPPGGGASPWRQLGAAPTSPTQRPTDAALPPID